MQFAAISHFALRNSHVHFNVPSFRFLWRHLDFFGFVVQGARPSLGQPEMPPKRPVVAITEHLRPQPSAGGDAQPVCYALTSAVQQAAQPQERPPR